MKQLSRNTDLFTESVIREMTRICDSVNGINLSQGFPDSDSPKKIKKAAIDAIQKNFNQYPITYGEAQLRAEISKKAKRYNNIDCDFESEITITCGATEAMIASLKAIINPKDEVIIFEPYYENYGPDVILSGAVPRYVTLSPPNWTFLFSELEGLFSKKTKAIIINTPNNPTGKVFSFDELSFIAELCIKWDVIAITDEIYEHIIYDNSRHISIASFPGMKERSITINSISKTYSVTGWRVGWAISSKDITKRIRKVHDFLTVGAPTPFQHAAIAGLNFNNEYYQNLSEQYFLSRNFLFRVLKNIGFEPILPQGAYYIFTGIKKLKKKFNASNDVDFCLNFLKEIGVASVPGSSFYSNPINGVDYARFAFCKKIETLQKVEKLFTNLQYNTNLK